MFGKPWYNIIKFNYIVYYNILSRELNLLYLEKYGFKGKNKEKKTSK